MAKVSLSISGVSEDMSSEEVQQKLAGLYNKPEKQFEKVSKSLFIMQQPYVLLKDVEQAVADKHHQRLTALGFVCDFGDGGLTLVPEAETKGEAATCPACGEPCGDAETCQHCGVFMKKFLKQKELDEKLQKQLQSASNSHERIQKFQAEEAKKQKELARAKQQAKLEKKKKKAQPAEPEDDAVEAVAAMPDDDVSDFKATYKEKRNYALPAALALVAVVVGGGGYFVNDYLNNRYVSDAPTDVASVGTEATETAGAAAGVAAAAGGAAAAGSGPIAAAGEEPEEVQETIFETWTNRSKESDLLKNQIVKLYEEGMQSSANGLVAGKTDPRDQVYGRQELIKLEGQNDKTDRKLLSAYMLVLALEDDADRVAATLNQSTIYRTLDRQEEAVKTYDQAAKIALTVKDPQQRVLSETAIAEHHLAYGNLDVARTRYQNAKDRAAEITEPRLKTAAFDYIVTSEVANGLTADAETTAEQITDAAAREQALLKVTEIADQNKTSGVAELAPLEAETGTGDELIDDLIKMNESNKKKIKAASSLLGQD
jgi:hypothetical protein